MIEKFNEIFKTYKLKLKMSVDNNGRIRFLTLSGNHIYSWKDVYEMLNDGYDNLSVFSLLKCMGNEYIYDRLFKHGVGEDDELKNWFKCVSGVESMEELELRMQLMGGL